MYRLHRKTISALFFMAVACFWSGGVVNAQDAGQAPAPITAVVTAVPFDQSPPGTLEVSLTQLGETAFQLRGPIDADEFSFSVPYRWQLKGSTYLQLYYDLLFDTQGQTAVAETPTNVLLEVYFDETLVTAFAPKLGSNQGIQLPMPAQVLADPVQNRHRWRFVLTTGRNCDEDGRTSLLLHPYSFMHLEYDNVAPTLDLLAFPRPVVQELLTPETLSLVVPDVHTANSLQSLASLAAMLGLKTDNSVTLDVVTSNEATPERLAANSVIVIGTPAENGYLATLYDNGRLPTTLDGSGAIVGPAGTAVALEDGVLQLATTPEGNVLLIVTGNTADGVARAARSLSANQNGPNFLFAGDAVVIEAINPVAVEAGNEVIADIYTLAELGFRDTTLTGVGKQSRTISFFVPSSWRITEDPLLLLTYISSAALVPEGSGLTVLLNERPVASTTLGGSTEGEQELLVSLPANEILLGATNRVRLQLTMDIALPCITPNVDIAWTRLKDNGRLQIAHALAAASDTPIVIKDPLTPLISRPDLSDILFALPETPTGSELNGLAGLAAALGDISRGSNFAPQASLGAMPAEAELANLNVVAFGEPVRSPIIAQINDDLPQPFVEEGNGLRQQLGNVVFRLADNLSIGVIEALHAPWNQQRAVTVVTGTSSEGVDWAIQALINNQLAGQLDGNVSFVRGDQIEALDLSAGMTDRASLLLVPTAVARLATAAESEQTAVEPALTDTSASTTETLAPAAVLEPTPIPGPQPAVGVLPEQYLPEPTGLAGSLRTAVIGLIIGGVLVALVGLLLTRRHR